MGIEHAADDKAARKAARKAAKAAEKARSSHHGDGNHSDQDAEGEDVEEHAADNAGEPPKKKHKKRAGPAAPVAVRRPVLISRRIADALLTFRLPLPAVECAQHRGRERAVRSHARAVAVASVARRSLAGPTAADVPAQSGSTRSTASVPAAATTHHLSAAERTTTPCGRRGGRSERRTAPRHSRRPSPPRLARSASSLRHIERTRRCASAACSAASWRCRRRRGWLEFVRAARPVARVR